MLKLCKKYSSALNNIKSESVVVYTRITFFRKSPYLKFLWSAFSCIWTEYGDLQSKSPYSVQTAENAVYLLIFIVFCA